MGSKKPNDRELLDAHEILSQAAAIAAHLERAGVGLLPKPSPDAAERLSDLFAHAAPVPDSLSGVPGSPKQEQPPASSPPPRQSPGRRQLFDSVPEVADESGSYDGPDFPEEQRQAALDVISAEVGQCARCEVLASCRTNTVFGEGHVAPQVVFFGEGPGADEDRSGRPFVGRAGQLLTKMIEACKFRREDVYIMNTVKCRPPGNRNPELDEIENCREYYQRQLQILRPEYIVCLGAISSRELLKSKLSVGRLRGKLHHYFDSKVLVTYHPAYLLRNPDAKRAAWEDLKLMLADAGIKV